MHYIIWGNAAEGFGIIGMFESAEAAENFAKWDKKLHDLCQHGNHCWTIGTMFDAEAWSKRDTIYNNPTSASIRRIPDAEFEGE